MAAKPAGCAVSQDGEATIAGRCVYARIESNAALMVVGFDS